MNKLLTSLEGMDEFVVTPAPNSYTVCLRITPEQAEHFGGNERIAVTMQVLEDYTAGIQYVRGVAVDNTPTEYTAPSDPSNDDSHFTDAQTAVLHDIGVRINKAVVDFYRAVQPDLEMYYAINRDGGLNIEALLELLEGM